MKKVFKTAIIGFCTVCLGVQAFQSVSACQRINPKTNNSTSTTNYEPSKGSLRSKIDSLQLNPEDVRMLIDKSDYRLSVLADTVIVKTYPVVFGTNPLDDKLREGDRCTPEGVFSVRDFYPHTSWSKFIWLDYPTADSWKKHNRAKAENKIPKDAKIGGEIGIHGVPKGQSKLIAEKENWTWGCISLTNKDVNELFAIVYKGMQIEIRE